MSKIFYDHLVIREEIIQELDKYVLTVEEREELIRLADETLHHQVLNVILSHLPKEKHPEFLTKFHRSPGDETILEYLKVETSVDIEKEIREEAERVKKEILAEIKRSNKS